LTTLTHDTTGEGGEEGVVVCRPLESLGIMPGQGKPILEMGSEKEKFVSAASDSFPLPRPVSQGGNRSCLHGSGVGCLDGLARKKIKKSGTGKRVVGTSRYRVPLRDRGCLVPRGTIEGRRSPF
jgi:hypothetical protein